MVVELVDGDLSCEPMSAMVALRSPTSVVAPVVPPRTSVRSAEVVGSGDDEAPGGQTGGEKRRLVPKAGVSVAEHYKRVAARSDRYAADSSARVATVNPAGISFFKAGGSQLATSYVASAFSATFAGWRVRHSTDAPSS